ncbi:cache domain-containing sensor histidine kinase [Robinsoniella sp. KNHs210]|uniref:cache domain-containing sensor histidine kinase n=1 Tax=Robinsoniella sp. KNHs210 TaxID=1469950 RepID=UPI0004881934|nr:sensor histidine kinase [Robinsoniella sp. KNHs210]
MRKIKLSISTILILVLTTFNTLAFLWLGFIISQHMETSIEETSMSYSHQIINQVQYNLNTFFDGINNTLYNFATTDSLIDILKNHDKVDDYTRLLNHKSINQLISSNIKAKEEISSIFVFNQDTFFTVPSIQFTPDEFIHQLLNNYPDFEHIKPQYYPIDYPNYYNQLSKSKEIMVALPIRDYKNHSKNNCGVLLMSIQTVKLDQLFTPLKKEGFEVYILDKSNNIYYSSDLSTLKEPFKFNKTLLEVSLPLSFNDWQVVITSDMSDMQIRMENVHKTIYTIITSAVIITILIIMYLSAKITYPLKFMANQMENINYDNLTKKIHPADSYKEINQLYNGYNQMLNRIENLIDSVYFERLRQKEAHFEALQSKINPHFLYNTLQSIYSLAILERHSDVQIVTIALSDMLEYITYDNSDQIPFSEELAYIHNYLEIQKRRYSNKFIIEYHIEKDAELCLINKLLIQPIVENAINHGFSQLTANGQLIISANILNGMLTIEITDNGKGIDSDILELLTKQMNAPQKDEKHKSIGLSNIQERIHLKYGPGYGVTVHSKKGFGTKVILKIPAHIF